MKRNVLTPILYAIFSISVLISCGKDKPLTSESKEITTTSHGDKFTLDTINSKVEWKGFKVFKSDNTSHLGSIKFLNGEVTLNKKRKNLAG